MRTSVKLSASLAAVAALSLGLTACGSDSGKAGTSADDALVVGASPTPHADILKFVKDNLAAKAGLKLEVKEYTDYVTPNTALEDGDIGANYFQTAAYLKDFNAKNGTHIVGVENVHVEPMGLYSKKDKKASEFKSGDTIAIPNDAVNEGRALQLLAANNIITLKDGAGSTATVADVKDAKGLKFKEIEAAQTPRSLDDVTAAVINGNYALEAKFKPSKDALVLESGTDNPNANFLAVKKGNENDPRVKKLEKLLNSAEVKQFIEKTYSDGSVIPSFGAVKS
ncbi:MetQ/NlpA family ABC transporter substrate-binding protein [Streptomyces beijiangensis]|uniref:Lipoprotein n=1 Tax=Streptomyces beijiangensis TaxID=163361 RepID=A0A939F2U3_9ACTN|nr:MetQ/NlpA family ABC transporter substrate-binding protein [Streptomyces beijiangensis]MBO0510713.1 MetQ/NlpA family ABC transporter substrate-binding protein [Streptomyces beijiangensis]